MSASEGVRSIRRGKVWLVGAGPGDPDLLTVRAANLVRAAEVLAYDELVSEEILALAPASAERIPVGRRCGKGAPYGGRIHPVVLERALAGRAVVRLKGGDPMVFGRGGEEAEELAAARVPFEIVPGISAALGAAAGAHVPLTYRGVASSVTFATARGAGEDDAPLAPAVLAGKGTVVFYMGLARLEATCAALVSAGRAPSTPAAVVSRATLPDERRVMGTLADLPARVRGEALPPPALLIVGEVVARAVASPEAPFAPARARWAAG
jgi:uroporphyrin-III C-methyltransferase